MRNGLCWGGGGDGGGGRPAFVCPAVYEKRARRQVVIGGHVQGCIWIDARDQASFLMELSVTTVAIEVMQHRSG